MKTKCLFVATLFILGMLSACQKDELETWQSVDQDGTAPAMDLKSGSASVPFGTLATITFIGVEYTSDGNSVFAYEVTSGSKPALLSWQLNITAALPGEGVDQFSLIDCSDKATFYGKDASLKKNPQYSGLFWLQFLKPYKSAETRLVNFTLQGHWYVDDILAVAKGSKTVTFGAISGPVPKWTCGNPFTDVRDGQEYSTVQIGTQCWMAENLNFESVGSNWYNEDPALGALYGRLYTWDAALVSCPNEWSLPDDNQWKILEMFLGMSQSDADGTMNRNSGSVGKKLKFTSGWNYGGNGDNSTGFSALPAGFTNNLDVGTFNALGGIAIFWTSSEGDPLPEPSRAWGRGLYSNTDAINRGQVYKTFGHSVRCLQN